MSMNIRQQGRQRRHMHTRKKVSGSAQRPRLSVFRSARHLYVQLIDDEQGKTLAAHSTKSKDLAASLAEAKNPVEKGFIVGKALAELAKSREISACVFDRSGYKYWGRVKAVADGAREGGLNF
ncbi:MAG: 50S ribosomal protein L18 [bacterium]|jgi:large subunit ribosomal protein L18|nr:50S ribosomal protein L18 [bacterium]